MTYPKRRVDKKACLGGTVINIIVALIFFGLLAFGILWLIKSFGEVGQQYTDTMVQTKYNAITVKCQTNLRTIGQNIQIYAVSNEGFPPSQEELMQFSGSTQLFRCPAPDGEKYIYIPGQNGGMSPANILVYEPKPLHDGRCSVLRLGGQLELLTPEELQQALEQTRAGIR
ncbi:MAG TPA: hypothetical protein VMW24_14885 [Sedimentisphaerales bacterium]|nr:hypothetical protein [Sedimentisphaerales bacterium]